MAQRLKLSLIIFATLQMVISSIFFVTSFGVLSLAGLLVAMVLLGIVLAFVNKSSKESLALLRENFDAFKEMSNHIAHDFSNPMHVIQFCGNSLYKHVDSKGEKFLKRILSSTNRSVEMIDQLREISKVKNREHKNFYDVHRFVVALLRIEFWQHLKKSSIYLDEKLRLLSMGIPAEDLIILLHTVYRTIICQHEDLSPIVEIQGESILANEIQFRINSNTPFALSLRDDDKLKKLLARSGGEIEVQNENSFLITLRGFFENYTQTITENINNISEAHEGFRLQ